MGSAKAMWLPSGSVIMTVLTLSPDVRSLASMFSLPNCATCSSMLVTTRVPLSHHREVVGLVCPLPADNGSDDSSVVSLFDRRHLSFVRGWSLESISQRLAVESRIRGLEDLALAANGCRAIFRTLAERE